LNQDFNQDFYLMMTVRKASHMRVVCVDGRLKSKAI
jgi:hypothetical protein